MSRTNENLLGLENDAVLDLRGHWLYVRKCKPAAIMLDTPDGKVELERPEKSVDICHWFEVLAIGTGCGEAREMEPHEFEWSAGVNWKVGDVITCPEHHIDYIKHSPWSQHEFFIDEALPTVRFEDGEYEPLGHRVLVEPKESWRDMGGDLLEMPDNAERLPTEAIVTGVGLGIVDQDGGTIPVAVTVGATAVLPHEDTFQNITVGDRRLKIVPIEKIEAILTS